MGSIWGAPGSRWERPAWGASCCGVCRPPCSVSCFLRLPLRSREVSGSVNRDILGGGIRSFKERISLFGGYLGSRAFETGSHRANQALVSLCTPRLGAAVR